MAAIPDPAQAPALYEGILTRRVMAYCVDFVLISILTGAIFVITLILGIATLGLAWLTLPFALPLAVVIYYAATLGSSRRATIGMQFFDIVLTPTDGPPLDGWKALAHPLVFWVTIWIFWPLLLVGLFTPKRQLLHDLITKTLMIRRSPMERHWSNMSGYAV